MATKVNRSTKSDFFYKFQKIIIKKQITKKKKLKRPDTPTRSFLSLDFFRRDVNFYSELGIARKSNLGRPPI